MGQGEELQAGHSHTGCRIQTDELWIKKRDTRWDRSEVTEVTVISSRNEDANVGHR